MLSLYCPALKDSSTVDQMQYIYGKIHKSFNQDNDRLHVNLLAPKTEWKKLDLSIIGFERVPV